MTALWRGPADRFEIARWVEGPHRGYRVVPDPGIGGFRIILRRQAVRRERLTGLNQVVWKGPADEIWRVMGRDVIGCLGDLWRVALAREIRHCRHLLREARKGNQ